MTTRVVAVTLVVAIASGCGPRTIHVVTPNDVDRANREIHGRRVTMTMEDGGRIPCVRAVIGLDTCECVDARVGVMKRVPVSSVKSVKVRRAGRGALWGFLGGVGVGAFIGGLGYLDKPGAAYAEVGLVISPVVGGWLALFSVCSRPLTST